MTTVLLIIQLITCIVLIGLILIQRSEGGALGMGGGGGGGGVMSGRSSANAVTKATTWLGAFFLFNCILLSIFFAKESQTMSRTADNPTEEGLNIDAESPNSDIPLADDNLAADEATDLGDEMPETDATDPETANTEDTQSPQ